MEAPSDRNFGQYDASMYLSLDAAATGVRPRMRDAGAQLIPPSSRVKLFFSLRLGVDPPSVFSDPFGVTLVGSQGKRRRGSSRDATG
jgi:hypothetical protein